MNRGTHAELLFEGLNKVYGLARKKFTKKYNQIFDVGKANKGIIDDLSMGGFGLVPEKPVSSAVSFDRTYQGYKTRYTATTYGTGYTVPQEFQEDDLYNVVGQLPRALARSENATIETLAAQILNRAFNNSYVGGDGKELCATDHPIERGGAFSNEPSSAADLSVDSLAQANIDIANITDGAGIKMQLRPTALIIPRALEVDAFEILKSTKRPGTANNNINPMGPEGTIFNLGEPIIWDYLTDDDAWFLKTDLAQAEPGTGLNCKWVRMPQQTRDNDTDTTDMKVVSTFRLMFGWTNPRNLYGNPGA